MKLGGIMKLGPKKMIHSAEGLFPLDIVKVYRLPFKFTSLYLL